MQRSVAKSSGGPALWVALLFAGLSVSCLLDNSPPERADLPERPPAERALLSVSLRVHHLDAMVSFYEEAFGAEFREVDTFGIASRFAEIDGVTIKLVPLRESPDFDGFPSHQLGFEVASLDEAFATAARHGGRREGEVSLEDGWRRGAVRDPDGNTIELYERRLP